MILVSGIGYRSQYIPASGEVSGIGYWDSVALISLPYDTSLTEHLLEQSVMARLVKRGFWEHFWVNADDESKACCKVCEESFSGYTPIT